MSCGDDDPTNSQITYKLHGLNFGPYLDGQDPNSGVIITEEQLRERLKIIQPYTQWIRTYGSTHGLENTASIADSMNLKVAAGAWLDRDITTNEDEISNLIRICKDGDADVAVVGSEVSQRGELTEEQLINYINVIREQIPDTVKIASADVCNMLIKHPAVLEAVDLILVNHHPFWEGIKIECAIAFLHDCHQRLTDFANGENLSAPFVKQGLDQDLRKSPFTQLFLETFKNK